MIIPLGINVLVKITKKKSSIELLPNSSAMDQGEFTATVEAVGEKCGSGIKVGHELIMPTKLSVTLVEQTEDYDLIIIPENIIPGVREKQQGSK